MARLLGLSRGESRESPREITRTNLTSESGESGWLIRFFDSAFFCEWIAVSYLYKHDHAGVRDYLCNRMYTLPHSGIESYLFQICYMLVHKPSPSLDRFVIDICSKSLKIALKVHWFLMAELEDSDDNEGISRIQEKCQIAATLMGSWPPLVRPHDAANSPGTGNMVLNKFLSSKQRFLSLTCSPPTQRSFSFSPSNTSSLEEGTKLSPDENKLFKKFIPSPKVRELFRKSTEKDEDDSGKDGFFRKLLRDSNSKDEVDELTSSSSDGFLKRLFRDSKNDLEEKVNSKSVDEDSDGFFKKLFREKKFEDKNEGNVRIDDEDKPNNDERGLKTSEDDKGFFRKFFKDKFQDKKDRADKDDEEERVYASGEEEEHTEISFFRKLFRVHPEDAKSAEGIENNSVFPQSSPGTEKFFRKLFKDRDRSVEDSELFGSEKHKERAGSPKQRNEKLNARPPPHSSSAWQFRKGTYHESLDFVQSLCDTSYGLVDIFPVEDRKSALRESLLEINSHVADAQNYGGVCFPMGKGMYRVVNIPVDEAILLNSREKAPYLICVEVMKGEISSNSKDVSNAQKYSRGIPLANGDALLPKPPPWACPLRSPRDSYLSGSDRLSRSTSKAIDQAMAHMWDAKVKFVNVSFSFEKELPGGSNVELHHCGSHQSASVPRETVLKCCVDGDAMTNASRMDHLNDLELVRVVLTADLGVRMEDIDDQEPPHRKEHRRVPSTVAMEEVKAAAVKGEAPPGLPLKGAGQDPSDSESNLISNGVIPNAADPLSGELWEVKKDRIRNASTCGQLSNWDLRSIIVKSGDDCRQEHLAVQLISHFYDIFQEAGLPLWLRPYEVLVTSSYTALIETIPDTASLHSIKGRFPGINSLRDFFIAKYQENSPSFNLAQRNFVESMAGYSLVCYLLQVKDRHNGNLLMDEEGHIIHIDFGFMLSNSPGGVNFESAPFKLTRELLEVMDSDAEGVPSEFFDYFKVLCIQGFLTCRKHAERIILLVEMLQESGFPCFKGGTRTIQNLRKRFHLSLTEEQCVSLVLSLISTSLDAWRTRQYDYYQRVLNGIL